MNQLRKRITYTIYQFIHDSRSVGILLILCTLFSLIVTNIAQTGSAFHQFWLKEFEVMGHLLPDSPLHFINDALMAVFFFLAGMEIKREFVKGELANIKNAVLPVVAAIFGVIFPAVIFLLFNKGTPFSSGWAIPTATDIAFSLGILSLLGKRIPYSLKIFLTALAIIDDLCAILIIALFYGSMIHWIWLLAVMIICVLLIFVNKKLKKDIVWFRIILGFLLWFCMFQSGIHPTVSGILFALLIPVDRLNFYENKIHFWVNFIIIPLFALANTSIIIAENPIQILQTTLSFGIVFGLMIGKPLGIITSSYIMIKKGWGIMPKGSNWEQFIGIGILAAIGFTMSIFISTLAFSDTSIQDQAKLAVITISFVCMIIGYLWLRIRSRNKTDQKCATKGTS